MRQCGGPILSREARTVQKRPCFYAETVVVNLDCAVLGGAVRASRFYNVVVIAQNGVLKVEAASQFTALIRADTSSVMVTVLRKEGRDDIDRGVFARG